MGRPEREKRHLRPTLVLYTLTRSCSDVRVDARGTGHGGKCRRRRVILMVLLRRALALLDGFAFYQRSRTLVLFKKN